MPAKKKKILYNRIKAALAERSMTNKGLAEKIQVTPETVSRWCTNDNQPPIETLFEIAMVLDVDIRELLVSTK
jgi:transcriptional regulator with XRE-family HTH domain